MYRRTMYPRYYGMRRAVSFARQKRRQELPEQKGEPSVAAPSSKVFRTNAQKTLSGRAGTEPGRAILVSADPTPQYCS